MVLSAALALGRGLAVGAPMEAIEWRIPKYSLTARSMPIRDALEAFAVAEGVAIVMSDRVTGAVSGDFVEVPANDFVRRIVAMYNLVEYYDGATLWLYGATETVTTMQDLRYMKAAEVAAMLKELGVEDPRFPLKTASNDELILVSGPPRYVQLVIEMIARADKLREMRTFNEIETRIFPLKHTWADDVNLGTSGSASSSAENQTQIRGVASILQDIMQVGNNSSGRTRDAATNHVDSAENRVLENSQTQFSPVIRAENRLNAVLVRDAVTRMPSYEKLIAELDIPQKLVEIDITTLELTRDDSLDWQLSLKVGASSKDGRHNGAAGQNAQNLFDTDSLAGEGLAGAYSYLGNHLNVSASVTALRTKGKAKNVSRTSILTLNNLEASMTDTQSYHAKVVGQEVATLEEVSAGTQLSVKPRSVPSPDGGVTPGQVWLTMSLTDGGFETISVDNMPMTRTSTVTTQASVFEEDSILLAGYFRDVEEDGGWGIPYLRDIPWIGWIFGGASRVKETYQRMFILTPRVIDLDLYRANTQRVDRAQATWQRDMEPLKDLVIDFEASTNKTEKVESETNTVDTASVEIVDEKLEPLPEEN